MVQISIWKQFWKSHKHRINWLCIKSNFSGILARAVLCKWAISVEFWLNYHYNTFSCSLKRCNRHVCILNGYKNMPFWHRECPFRTIAIKYSNLYYLLLIWGGANVRSIAIELFSFDRDRTTFAGRTTQMLRVFIYLFFFYFFFLLLLLLFCSRRTKRPKMRLKAILNAILWT